MAKTPAPQKMKPASCDISKLPDIVQNLGLVNFNVSCEDGSLTVTGKNTEGKHFRVNGYQGNGFTEGTMSTFESSSRDARQFEAIRLRNAGFTQQEIADRLGVSQKTISNDLR